MNVEARFRYGESILDQALAKTTPQLDGIKIHELSGRTYHYKNDHLSWCYQFIQDTAGDYETKRIAVFLTFMEPADLKEKDEVSILVRGELFQPGQTSRVDKKLEYRISLKDLEHADLLEILNEAFQKGDSLLN